ncbi:hypothetical protein N0V90_002819 [Kalmusia sp. IMI 367209]|nr:hypothetical protein N0V90_002819 [Kalmusia sp. IMI 367209]
MSSRGGADGEASRAIARRGSEEMIWPERGGIFTLPNGDIWAFIPNSRKSTVRVPGADPAPVASQPRAIVDINVAEAYGIDNEVIASPIHESEDEYMTDIGDEPPSAPAHAFDEQGDASAPQRDEGWQPVVSDQQDQISDGESELDSSLYELDEIDMDEELPLRSLVRLTPAQAAYARAMYSPANSQSGPNSVFSQFKPNTPYMVPGQVGFKRLWNSSLRKIPPQMPTRPEFPEPSQVCNPQPESIPMQSHESTPLHGLEVFSISSTSDPSSESTDDPNVNLDFPQEPQNTPVQEEAMEARHADVAQTTRRRTQTLSYYTANILPRRRAQAQVEAEIDVQYQPQSQWQPQPQPRQPEAQAYAETQSSHEPTSGSQTARYELI